jgi:predicted GNAT family acetyltransferase
MQVEIVDDPAVFLAATGAYLAARPAHHNLILSIAHARVDWPVAGRYAWAHERGRVVAVAVQSPETFPAALGPGTRTAVGALAHALADHAPDLPGVVGEAFGAAGFAGEWASVTRARVSPRAAQRLHRATRVRMPSDVPGVLREVDASEVPEVAGWILAFQDETGERAVEREVREEVDHLVRRRSIWCWDDGGRAAITSSTFACDGVARVRHVYTPPERRRHGYAAACAAGVSALLLGRGADACVLYTQLTNPTANALYRPLGYRPIAEILAYEFAR